MAPKFTEKRVGQFMFDQVESVFAGRVMARRKEIELETREVYKGFFKEMAGLVGVDSTPDFIQNQIGGEWPDISDKWIDRKGYPYTNKFYEGLGPKSYDKFKGASFHDEILSKSVPKTYGPLKLSVKVGRSGAEWNPKSRRFHYGGKFVSGADAGVTVVIDSFPWVKNDKDLNRGFSPRVANILIRNEPWGAKYWGDGAARPFLTPMVRYYVETELPKAVRKAVTR